MAKEEQEVAKSTVPPDERLVSYFKAGYPLLYMVTAEETRAETQLIASVLAVDANNKIRTGRETVVIWSATDGLFSPTQKDSPFNLATMTDPVKALKHIKDQKAKRAVYIFRDLHAFFQGGAGLLVIRYLRDLYKDFQQLASTFVILSPVARLPADLQRDVTQIDFNLPDRAQITEVWGRLYASASSTLKAKKLDPDDDARERIISAAMGLTSQEATNAFAMALVDAVQGRGTIDRLVLKEKALAVKKSGILEYYETNTNIDSIGGLENLKTWLLRRARSFTAKARAFGLPLPKGALFVGIPGGGKSLSAKATASILQVPLIRFDIGRVFGGLVGQSEEQMRVALQTIDAIGPCVVWVDEMEKAFAGASGSGSGDNGVTRRVFGNFLTWMQEKTTPSFVVATANSIIGVPPELLRKGRFDENFYVGLPSDIARGEIFKIHLKAIKREGLSINIPQLVGASKEFTGAEIEYAIHEGLYAAFEKDRDLITDDIFNALKVMKPISMTQKDELQEMTKWAKDNAVNASKVDPKDSIEQGGRQLAL